jgi:hypothetical protein
MRQRYAEKFWAPHKRPPEETPDDFEADLDELIPRRPPARDRIRQRAKALKPDAEWGLDAARAKRRRP